MRSALHTISRRNYCLGQGTRVRHSLGFAFSNSEHVFGKVCSKVQNLKLEWRDAPLANGLSTRDWWDAQEIDATLWGRIGRQYVPAKEYGAIPR